MSELLNLVGLSTGVVLYAMLLVMVLRARRVGAKPQRDPLLLVTAALGLIWNLCALPIYELPKIGIVGPFPWVAATGFAALGFLPAVVVHSVVRGSDDQGFGSIERLITGFAYAVSAAAAISHIMFAVVGWPVPSTIAMRTLTYAFVGLVVPVAAIRRHQPGSRRALWVAALAIFAVSALHLSQLHRDAPWPIELLGHHASLPLAVAILYQDYPFALADLFLKRALALIGIIALAFVLVLSFGARSTSFATFMHADPRRVGLLVTLWVATALAYPRLRTAVSWLVDRVILRRADYASLRTTVLRGIHTQESIPALLTYVCDVLTPALNAARVVWHERQPEAAADSVRPVIILGNRASVLVPTADAPRFTIEILELSGGRRLLSDDVAMLEAIALGIARRIDAIRIIEERYDRGLREQEMGKLASEAELRALRAQINPHFLFNALTSIGYLIQTTPSKALETLMHLTALLRAVLRSEGEFTTLGREVSMVQAYLDIERARFENRLRVRIDVPAMLHDLRLPPLLLQPLVENAVKHGIAPHEAGGEVSIWATVEESPGDARRLRLCVHNTSDGVTPQAIREGRERGVGLRNVERRLAGQYGDAASLSIVCVPGQGTTVDVRLPITVSVRDIGRIPA